MKLIRATTTLLLLGFGFMSQVSHAQSDVLLQAISFAVTGSDATKVATIDRQQCIFRVKSETFYFNNMYTDRIRFQHLQNKLGSVWSVVELHGKQKMVESSPAKVPDNLAEMN